MKDESVGATTGIRWYIASRNDNIGTVVRSIWNAAAIVQMFCYRIAWGGSLMLRVSAIKESGILEKWRTAFCEDTMVQPEFAKIGKSTKVVSNLIMASDESCSVESFSRWCHRQLLTSRLYHPKWFLVGSHGFWSAMIPLVSMVGVIVSLASSDWSSTLNFGIAFSIVGFVFPFLVQLIIKGIEWGATDESVDLRLTETKRTILLAMPHTWLLQILYPIAALKAQFANNVEWRGVDYKIESDRSVTLENYVPYAEIQSDKDESQSL